MASLATVQAPLPACSRQSRVKHRFNARLTASASHLPALSLPAACSGRRHESHAGASCSSPLLQLLKAQHAHSAELAGRRVSVACAASASGSSQGNRPYGLRRIANLFWPVVALNVLRLFGAALDALQTGSLWGVLGLSQLVGGSDFLSSSSSSSDAAASASGELSGELSGEVSGDLSDQQLLGSASTAMGAAAASGGSLPLDNGLPDSITHLLLAAQLVFIRLFAGVVEAQVS